MPAFRTADLGGIEPARVRPPRPGGLLPSARVWRSETTSRAAAIGLLGVWLTVVIVTVMHHEYWRDEIRPWLLAGGAHSVADLFHRIRYEGHPLLWYLILYLTRATLDTPLALPIMSITIAALAMVIFMLRSPFPLWLKALFLFSGLPLYEYSVMARNYGISMLLMFLAASLYRERDTRWLSLSIVLALLANTNVHSIVLASLWLMAWAGEEMQALVRGRPIRWQFLVAVGIVLLGVGLSALAAYPPRDTILTQFYARTPADFAVAIRGALLAPAAAFATLFPHFVPWALGHVILYLAVLGLLRRPCLSLAAFGGLVGFGVLFRVAYPGSYRHAGLLLCFLVALYWVVQEQEPRATRGLSLRVFNVGLYGGLAALILASVYKDDAVRVDLRSEMSSSKAFGAFLRTSPGFRNAILVPEPDYYIESVLYYAPNAVYLPREHRFGTTVTWSSVTDADLSLSRLVAVGRELKARYHRPVLLVVGHPTFATDSTGDIRYLYRKHFSWTASEREEALRELIPVARFARAVGNENYWVYAVN